MGIDWELVRSGPDGAEHGVLLLPGGANAARSYSEVMAQPVLAGTRDVDEDDGDRGKDGTSV